MTASIAISILAYNEEVTIASVVSESLAILPQFTDDFEVIVIDDGSVDRTGSITRDLADHDSRVKVIHHPVNLGFGRTMREVWKIPQKEWIFFIPGDGQIPASELAALWPWHDRADFILGWRKTRQDSWFRRVLAYHYNALIRLVTGCDVHDIDSVALIRKAFLDQMQLKANSPFIHAECYLEARRLGARIAEIPVRHIARSAGQARGVRLGNTIKTAWEFVHYIREHSA